MYGTGPFADDNNDCEYFCKAYPRIVPRKEFYITSIGLMRKFLDIVTTIYGAVMISFE
jgi:hypothetical protein